MKTEAKVNATSRKYIDDVAFNLQSGFEIRRAKNRTDKTAKREYKTARRGDSCQNPKQKAECGSISQPREQNGLHRQDDGKNLGPNA